jgi:hypothetical protein
LTNVRPESLLPEARDPAEAMPMNELLTFEQIQARYPAEWVLVGDPQTDNSLELLAGRVLWHSTRREEVDQKLLELRPERFALRFLGRMPENTALVL